MHIKIHIKQFVEGLSPNEVYELSNALYERRHRLAIDKVKDIELTREEIITGCRNKIQGIKMVRERLGLGLLEAKTLVELKCFP